MGRGIEGNSYLTSSRAFPHILTTFMLSWCVFAVSAPADTLMLANINFVPTCAQLSTVSQCGGASGMLAPP